MTTATVGETTDTRTKPPKLWKYYGLEYTQSVETMAAMSRVSVRLQKDVLKLHSLGYEDKIMEGWTAKQCFDHAGIKRGQKTPPTRAEVDQLKVVIMDKRDQLADAEYEITRLREMVSQLGGDPDNDF